MLFILDTNVIASDPVLRSPAWDAAEGTVKDSRIRVLIPTFAIDEAVAVYKRNRNATSVQIKKLGRHASKAVKDKLAEAITMTVEEANGYTEILAAKLERRGPKSSGHRRHRTIWLLSVPFSACVPLMRTGPATGILCTGSQVLDIVQDHYESQDIVFISADARAFGGRSQFGSAPELHEHQLRGRAVRSRVTTLRRRPFPFPADCVLDNLLCCRPVLGMRSRY